MASKTLALRSAIQSELKKLCDRVYFGQADSDAAFPYLVYTIEELAHDACTTLCALEVNAVDYGKDTSACETLSDGVQNGLDNCFYSDANIIFSCYRERRQPVTEEDRQIIRRRMTFEVRMHERG